MGPIMNMNLLVEGVRWSGQVHLVTSFHESNGESINAASDFGSVHHESAAAAREN
jgi:hypothetical protein